MARREPLLDQECGPPSILQSARLVSHYARCIPSKALYRRCLQRCSDKGSYRTGLERTRVAEAKCNTGCSTIEHRHSRLPSCEVGIVPDLASPISYPRCRTLRLLLHRPMARGSLSTS